MKKSMTNVILLLVSCILCIVLVAGCNSGFLVNNLDESSDSSTSDTFANLPLPGDKGDIDVGLLKSMGLDAVHGFYYALTTYDKIVFCI